MRVTFNELAERELNDAAQYYEHEQPGLGAAFIAEVRRCTASSLNIPNQVRSSSALFGVYCASDFRMGFFTRLLKTSSYSQPGG